MALHQAKIPTIITASIICLLLGGGAGAAAMMVYGYHWKPQQVGGSGGGMSSMGGMPGGMGGMSGGMGGGMGGGGGRGPSPKSQLASLVTKLDLLTSKSLNVEFDAQQQQKVKEQLKGLAEKDELSDDEARQKLDALLEVVRDQRATLEAAGYRWPAGEPGKTEPAKPTAKVAGPGKKAPEPANPFSEGQNNKHLRDLEGRLSKANGKSD